MREERIKEHFLSKEITLKGIKMFLGYFKNYKNKRVCCKLSYLLVCNNLFYFSYILL